MSNIKVLISKEKIEKRTDEIAKEIYEEYKNKDVTALCTLKGSIFFAVDLLKKIPLNFKNMVYNITIN